MTTLNIQSTHNSSFKVNVEAIIMRRITNLLPAYTFKPQRWEHLADLTLADPSYHRIGRIDLVLGADVLAQAIMQGVRTGPMGTPIAQQTQFGWILSGKIAMNPPKHNTVTSLHTTSNLESLMERFLAIEAVDETNPLNTEEQWCEQHFLDTHRRDGNGRFIVRLPFRFLFDPSTPSLGRSRDIAVKRLLQLERRFAQNTNLKTEYLKAIKDHMDSGRLKPTSSTEIDANGHIQSAYLPHHAVVKESSTSTKLRVVFDGSRKTTTGTALNEILLVGPTIQRPLVTIFINWRFLSAAWMADVQKMYLQVQVDERDIEYQRIVWRDHPSDPIADYALTRLTFGTSSAPFLAIRAVTQLAETHRDKYPEAAEVILKDAYVDDVLSGGDDVETAKRLQREVANIMKAGGFELKKWASNINEILEQVPESDREIQLPVELNADDTIKALGIAWSPAADSIGFKSSLEFDKNQSITKRTALSTAAKLFDPVGLIAPIVVVAKIFIKKLWALDLDWDQPIPAHLRDEWLQYIEGLQRVPAIKIPRWINSPKENQTFELHGFCDASAMAYGAAVYFRTTDRDNIIHTHLIASKSKVAPKKALTIPRLELCGAQLLANLMSSIRQGLRHVSIAPENVHLWCDSEIVCYWIRSTKPLKVFIENRIA